MECLDIESDTVGLHYSPVPKKKKLLKTKKGCRAVFEEQEVSASQTAAASWLDPIEVGVAGEASVSACTQVKMTEASSHVPPSFPPIPKFSQFAKRRMSREKDQDALTTKFKKLGKTLTERNLHGSSVSWTPCE